MTIKEISEKRWVYTLYEVNGKHVITVPFTNSFIDFSRAFEVELDSLEGDYLVDLAGDIVANYENYKDREVDLPD